jgi:hypothetical protein
MRIGGEERISPLPPTTSCPSSITTSSHAPSSPVTTSSSCSLMHHPHLSPLPPVAPSCTILACHHFLQLLPHAPSSPVTTSSSCSLMHHPHLSPLPPVAPSCTILACHSPPGYFRLVLNDSTLQGKPVLQPNTCEVPCSPLTPPPPPAGRSLAGWDNRRRHACLPVHAQPQPGHQPVWSHAAHLLLHLPSSAHGSDSVPHRHHAHPRGLVWRHLVPVWQLL